MPVPDPTHAEPLIANNLRAVRIAAGFASVAELAERAGLDAQWCAHIEEGRVLASAEEYRRLLEALGGIPANRIYDATWRQLTLVERPEPAPGMAATSAMWRQWRDEARLLMARDELTYFDQSPGPEHRAEVYLNLSCSTQRSPHLLLDTVSVLEALGVDFVAAAGPAGGCCGKPLAVNRSEPAFERHRSGRLERSLSWGVTTHVNWCAACQQTSSAAAARHALGDGDEHPVREIQLLPFLEERIRSLGPRVPWTKRVRRQVVAEGHPGHSNVHHASQQVIPRLLSMVPGVEAVGLYDGWWELSPCATFALEGSAAPEWTRRAETPEEVEAHRRALARDVRSRGADTVSCMHQTCHQLWSRYASDDLDVVHPVSVIADALGCAHDDRFQDAVRHGDPQRLLEESRDRWGSWGMTPDRATEVAQSICTTRIHPTYSSAAPGDDDGSAYAMVRRVDAGSACGGCGGGSCHVRHDPAGE